MTLHKLLVVGAGGIGSYFTDFISRTGLFDITIADGDTIEAKNLLSQNYKLNDVGKSKSARTAHRLRGTPNTSFVHWKPDYIEYLTDFDGYDYIVMCVDNDHARNLLYQWAKIHNKQDRVIDARCNRFSAVVVTDAAVTQVDAEGTESHSCQEGAEDRMQLRFGHIMAAAMAAQTLMEKLNNRTASFTAMTDNGMTFVNLGSTCDTAAAAKTLMEASNNE